MYLGEKLINYFASLTLMLNRLLIAAGIVILGIIIYFGISKPTEYTIEPTSKPDANGVFFSTVSETNERIQKLGMDKPSEDRSAILDKSALSVRIENLPPEKGNDQSHPVLAAEVEALVLLKGDRPFNGMDAWDALLCTGLKWGDGDLFHWENDKNAPGDEALFSVATNTEPGYFLPEEVKSGKMNPEDLMFAFAIGRSRDPENVFKAMLKAAKYCQKRLGGRLLDKFNKPFDEDKELRNLQKTVRKMKSQGMAPGSEAALKSF